MSETIRGHHTATQTLSAAAPNVTIAGEITAYGAAGVYLRHGATSQIHAALFAPASASFNIFNLGYIGATIPGSPSPVIDYGIALGTAANLTNTGTIAGPAGIGAFGAAASSFINAGLVTASYYAGIDAFNAPATLANTGTIAAESVGVALHHGGAVTNTGSISGAAAGIAAYVSPLTLLNAGAITSRYGLALYAGGQITDSGLISGSGVAIKNTGPLSLMLTPGARLIGAVDDISGGGALTLAGSTAGELNIGIDFFGMPNISFAPGATWTLEGAVSELASGQSISGFGAADLLILDGFAATSDTAGAAGLTLANASATETLALNAPAGQSLAFTSYFGNTTIQAASQPAISLISSILTGEVSPGNNGYAGILTIASTGGIVTTGTYALFASASGVTVTNFGEINTYDPQLGGIFLSGGATLANAGEIHTAGGIYVSGRGSLLNSGYIYAEYSPARGAVELNAAALSNSGTLNARINDLGGSFIENSGILLQAVSTAGGFNNTGTVFGGSGIAAQAVGATVTNSGTFSSSLAGAGIFSDSTLTNSGQIWGGDIGAYINANGRIFNFGAIAGGTTGILLQLGDGAAEAGIINAGTISGGTYAILETERTESAVLELTVAPGGSFIGAVRDELNTGTLILAGPGAGTLDIGGSFSGFSAISFAAGSSWTLEGSLTPETLTGFAPADTLILDGFAATAYTASPGAGLILSNATSAETLSLAGLAPGQAFSISSAFNNTTITDTIGIPPLVISTYATNGVLPSSGEAITITRTGAIGNDGPAIYIGNAVSNVYILNQGALLTPLTALPAIYGNGNNITIRNTGSIGAEQAVYLRHFGTLFNAGQIAGTISNFGVRMVESSLDNSGTIAAALQGVVAFTACDVTSSGAIYGGEFGVILDASSFGNTGTVGSTFTAVDVLTYGTFLNAGLVTSTAYGIQGLGLGFITNTGAIWGGLDGAALDFSGSTFYPGGFADTSLASTFDNVGSLGGGSVGLKLGSGLVDVVNAGTITGGGNAILAKDAFTLTAEPGAVFNGAVTDDAGAGTLILAGNTPGSLDIAADFTGFSALSFAAGASWTLEGTTTQLAGGETINGFARGDTIILDGFSASSVSYVAGAGLILSNAEASETIDITGTYGAAAFTLGNNAGGGTEFGVACFVRGTRILTPRGNVPIEKLNIGDLVKTMHGDQPIRWIGRRAYAGRFIAGNVSALPIRIRRHAIALNLPSRDLYVSPDHAIAEGGVLIHAHLLLNGISFQQPQTESDVEYFHLEFDTHTVLFAENFSVESFIDEGAGNRFQNAHTRIPTVKPQTPCLPRVFEGFHLHNIKSRIALRAGIPTPTTLGALLGTIDEATPTLIRGWAQNSAAPEHPVTLEIISGGFSRLILANAFRPDLRDAGIGSGCHGFSAVLPHITAPLTVRRVPDGALLAPCARPQKRHPNA